MQNKLDEIAKAIGQSSSDICSLRKQLQEAQTQLRNSMLAITKSNEFSTLLKSIEYRCGIDSTKNATIDSIKAYMENLLPIIRDSKFAKKKQHVNQSQGCCWCPLVLFLVFLA